MWYDYDFGDVYDYVSDGDIDHDHDDENDGDCKDGVGEDDDDDYYCHCNCDMIMILVMLMIMLVMVIYMHCSIHAAVIERELLNSYVFVCYLSALGFTNGCVRIIDAVTLRDEGKGDGVAEFNHCHDSVTHIKFSHNSRYLATAVRYRKSVIYIIIVIIIVKRTSTTLNFNFIPNHSAIIRATTMYDV